VDLAAEKRNGDFVRALIADKIATAVHDVSDGGLAVALAEMAMASGIGADLQAAFGTLKQTQLAGLAAFWPKPLDPFPHPAFWFGEDQARYVVTVRESNAAAVLNLAGNTRVPLRRIGTTGGDELTLPAGRPILIAKLLARFENWLPFYMAGAEP
jgi:phosphoribosylformylglycinamidine synthase